MIEPGYRETTVQAMRKSLAGFIQDQRKGVSRLSSRAADIPLSAYLQQTPIGDDVIESVYGSADEFMATYKGFMDAYIQALEDPSTHAKTKTVNVDLMKRTGRVDLTVFNYETSQALHQRYLTDVLKMDRLLNQVGLPGVQMPSSNLFKQNLKYLVDPEATMHPAVMLLARSNITFNRRMAGIESLGVGRSNILSMDALSQIFSQLTSGDMFNMTADEISSGKSALKVVTLDVETSGVFDFSHVRSFSAIESTYSGGVLSGHKEVANVLFDSPQLHGYTVQQTSGGRIPLSQYFHEMEPRADYRPMSNFLDESTSFIDNVLLKADRIAGHNLFFDLNKMTQTMLSMEGFHEHQEAQRALKSLWEKVWGGDYVVDTLETSRQYFEKQVGQILKAEGVPDEDIIERAAKYVNTMFSNEILGQVQIGGSAAPSSISNIALNTNLFELIEANESPETVEEFRRALTGGSHVSSADTRIQAFMANYMQSGELKILRSAADRTASGQMLRSVILRSQALTPTTNIADVQRLSGTAFDYLKGRGLRDLVLNLEDGSMFGGKGPGTLAYVGDKLQFMPYDGDIMDVADTPRAQNEMRRMLDLARSGDEAANRSVVSTGISIAAESDADEMRSILRSVSRPTTGGPTADALKAAFGSVYESYGSGLTLTDRMYMSIGLPPRDTPFEAGLGQYAAGTPVSVARKFADIGDPFYFLDARSRAASTMLASATASLGQKANLATIQAGVEAADVAFSSTAKLTAELGISYFNPIETSAIFGASMKELDPSKIIAPMEIVKTAFNFDPMSEDLRRVLPEGFREFDGLIDDTFRHLSLSVLPDESAVNLVWNVNRQMDRATAEIGVRNMLELMSDERIAARAMGVEVTDLSESVRLDIQAARTLKESGTEAVDTAVARILDEMFEGGLVVGDIRDEKIVGKVVKSLKRMGIDTGNDVLARNFSFSLLRTRLKGVLTLTPGVNDTSVSINGNTGLIDDALSVADDGSRMSKATKAYNAISQKILEEEGMVGAIKRRVLNSKTLEGTSVLANFYKANKTKLGVGALVTAAVGTGYYMMKEKQERNLYSETTDQMPYESGLKEDPLAEVKQNYTYAPIKSDPFATANVVSNLDQNKIGHYQMGPNKYDHLFGR